MWKRKPQELQINVFESPAPLDALAAEWQPEVEAQLRQTSANALMELVSPEAETHSGHIDSLVARIHDIRSVLAYVRDKTAAVVPVVLESYGQVGEADHGSALAVAPDYQLFASPRYWAGFVLMGVEGETAEKADIQATATAASFA